MTRILTQTLRTPLGVLHLFERDGALCGLDFASGAGRLRARLAARFGAVRFVAGNVAAAAAVRRYLDGDLGALDALAVDAGGTAFQARVWAELRRIPAGATRSYRQVAAAVGSPAAVRAVGSASARNPVALVIPCHRVVGSDGGLAGYAGGIERKRWLLSHEAVEPTMW